MNHSIFRQKSIDRMSSPEELNDYVRVATPSVWIILIAIILLLLGVCTWGIFGKLDTKCVVPAKSENGKTLCYITEEQLEMISEGMPVIINKQEGKIIKINRSPVDVKNLSTFLLHINDIEKSWVYEVECDITVVDGEYKAFIIVESVSPMSFVIN